MKAKELIIFTIIFTIIFIIIVLIFNACSDHSKKSYHDREVDETMHELYQKGSDGLWYAK